MTECSHEEKELAVAFKALGDCNRMRIYKMVTEKDGICACDILDALDISQPTLSHHMKLLVDARLINSEKSGKWTHYSINIERAAQLIRFLKD